MSGSPHDAHRIAGYLGSMGTFAALWATTHRAVSRSGRAWPSRWAASDVLLGSVATHKLSRIISKEGVTTPLRAPFTEFEGEAGAGEVVERPKHGAAHVPGELLTCPFCLAPWIATAYVAGLVLAPGPTRAGAAVFATVAGSDALQHAYARLRTT
jgi:hypothetical protein